MIELGQMCFGNKWESSEAPEWMEHELGEIREELERRNTWYEGESNAVFDIRPYYWGDCVCGYEQAESAWCEANDHEDSCYQKDVESALLAAGWTQGPYGLLDAPKAMSYDAKRETEDGIRREACKRHGLTFPNGCAVHCTCSYQRRWGEWRAANDHADDCPIVQPNFLHKASGIAVHWYKHIGRSMTCSREVSRAEWRKIMAECRAALGME